MKRQREDADGNGGAEREDSGTSAHDDAAGNGANGYLAQSRGTEPRRDCPYLDTVNRQVLDFDFEKFCSVSLSNLNVYACLVCGKYFQGRGPKSHAFTHSLEALHHVFINLKTERVYCLPDSYEVNDPSLDDIRSVLNPRFPKDQLAKLDTDKAWARALDGSDYIPGMIGLNNIKSNDYVNVMIQALMRVKSLRDYFLLPSNYDCRAPLVVRFGELTRKIWHPRNFKGQVSPHEFLQAVLQESKKRFKIDTQSDPVEFLSWLLNRLHTDLVGKNRPGGGAGGASSIIHKCFQGELEVETEYLTREGAEEAGERAARAAEGGGGTKGLRALRRETTRVPFVMLGLDLPPPPLFKDVMEKNIIPQVPLFTILKKFDGETWHEVVRPHLARKRYRVTQVPPYLILHMKRFTKNNFFIEKNPTLVNFPLRNLELKDYIPLEFAAGTKYNLIANVVHEGRPGAGNYKVHVHRTAEDLWYEIQDLHVAETLPQMVALSETYMQIYELQSS